MKFGVVRPGAEAKPDRVFFKLEEALTGVYVKAFLDEAGTRPCAEGRNHILAIRHDGTLTLCGGVGESIGLQLTGGGRIKLTE